MKPYLRRKQLEAIARKGKFAQFGQKHDRTTSNGSEACTHVVLQFLTYIWTSELLTIDQISADAGYTQGDQGMNSTHVDRVIAKYKLPYVATFRMAKPPNADGLLHIVRSIGPALIAVPYGLYPLDAGIAKNNEAIQGGRNDLGFAGNHAVALFAAKWQRKTGRYWPRAVDPDHGSPARPAIPDFDIFTDRQLARMWNHNLVGRTYSRFGYVPTREWTGLPKEANP